MYFKFYLSNGFTVIYFVHIVVLEFLHNCKPINLRVHLLNRFFASIDLLRFAMKYHKNIVIVLHSLLKIFSSKYFQEFLKICKLS